MSNLRDVAARVAAEIREYICAPYRNVNDQLLRRWTDNLTAAIKADAEAVCQCPKHPMRKAEADIATLRTALVGLVGGDGKETLEQMEAALRIMPVPMADKAASIDAIHALLATLPNDRGDSLPPRKETNG